MYASGRKPGRKVPKPRKFKKSIYERQFRRPSRSGPKRNGTHRIR